MALTFDSLTEDGGRQRAMSLRLPGGDVNSFGGWFPSVSLNALRRLSSTTRSEQLSTSLDKPRKRSRISLATFHFVQQQPELRESGLLVLCLMVLVVNCNCEMLATSKLATCCRTTYFNNAHSIIVLLCKHISQIARGSVSLAWNHFVQQMNRVELQFVNCKIASFSKSTLYLLKAPGGR
ncbi:Monofunctional pimaradiene synthase [Trichinella pseudospiralis]